MTEQVTIPFELQMLITLDSVLVKMMERLAKSFDPGDPVSIKLLREFRTTMRTRTGWAKEYHLMNGKESVSSSHPVTKEKSAISGSAPKVNQAVLLQTPPFPPLNEKTFTGMHPKKPFEIPGTNQKSGLLAR